MTFKTDSEIRRNNRPNKPYEDFLCMKENVFVVTDGVTQNADEYRPGMTASDAGFIARLTAENIADGLETAADPTADIATIVKDTIEKAGKYNETEAKSAFPAAAVFVSGAIRGDTLHFAYLGDSMIMLIRNGVRIRLSEQQTAHLRVFGSTSGLKITKRQMYDTITNNISHPLSYGVVFGDMRAMDFLRAASITLQKGDRIIFSSDGIDKYLFYAPIEELATLSAKDMLDRSNTFDVEPYNTYADDKSVIIVDVE